MATRWATTALELDTRGPRARAGSSSRKRELNALDLAGLAGVGDAGTPKPIAKPFRRRNAGTGLSGRILGSGFSSFRIPDGDALGLSVHMGELGRFNPLIVTPFHQRLMRRSVYPRLALTILKAALSQRQYVVEGDDATTEAFHQRWIDALLPSILRRATDAIWHGWKPFALDYERVDGLWVPVRANDLDVFDTTALRDPESGHYVGLQTEDGRYGPERSFWLTWDGEQGDPYGEGQALTCYPYWWAASVALVWMMRYYERSVDPVRIAFARNISVPTGRANADGTPEMVDLTQLVAEAMDATAGGDSMAMPIGEADDGKSEELVKIETLDLPDRADQWMKLLDRLEQRQFMSTLSLPGVSVATGETTFASSREAAKVQLSILEFASDMPLEALNERLIPLVHKLNNLPGEPPKAKGKAFKREQEETLRELLKAYLTETVPEVNEDGEQTGKFYRVGDQIRWPFLLRALDIAGFETSEIARNKEDILPPAPGKGGRPTEPLGQRGEDRASGLDRRAA